MVEKTNSKIKEYRIEMRVSQTTILTEKDFAELAKDLGSKWQVTVERRTHTPSYAFYSGKPNIQTFLILKKVK